MHRARQHRAANHNGVETVFGLQRGADLGADTLDIAEIQRAVAGARRANAYQRDLGRVHRFRHVGRRPQAAGRGHLRHQFGDALFHDRGLAGVH